MAQFIEGFDRQQTMLLPEHLDDYVDEKSPVRAIDAFIDLLDLSTLGFNAQAAATGRPGYHPGLMLRIYLYGYLNQVQSSRRLERECGRNLELMWLTGRLKPDFKTIADFRKDNGPAIRKVCQQFVALCRNMELLDGDVVAIDGSRFKALNSKAKNYTRGKLRQKLGEIDKAIERYLGELDRADEVFKQTGTVLPEARMERTLRKLEHLQKEAVRYRSIEQRMDETGETQVSLSDPDARSMATTARMPRIVGYNVQTAVEAEDTPYQARSSLEFKAYTEGSRLPDEMWENFGSMYFDREDFVPPQLWLGSVPTDVPATPLHRDPLTGFLFQVMGRKRLDLYSADQADLLYPYKSYNTYQKCWFQPDQPDYEKYPKARQAKCISVELHPGELLVQPAGWFHQVYALDSPTMSVSYFWRY